MAWEEGLGSQWLNEQIIGPHSPLKNLLLLLLQEKKKKRVRLAAETHHMDTTRTHFPAYNWGWRLHSKDQAQGFLGCSPPTYIHAPPPSQHTQRINQPLPPTLWHPGLPSTLLQDHLPQTQLPTATCHGNQMLLDACDSLNLLLWLSQWLGQNVPLPGSWCWMNVQSRAVSMTALLERQRLAWCFLILPLLGSFTRVSNCPSKLHIYKVLWKAEHWILIVAMSGKPKSVFYIGALVCAKHCLLPVYFWTLSTSPIPCTWDSSYYL